MKKNDIIIIYATPAYGHINPVLPIAAALVSDGYEVIFYATEEFRKEIEGTGAVFEAYDFGNLQFSPQIGSHILPLTRLILEFTEKQSDTMISSARNRKPVLIIHDTLAFWGRMTAETIGVKAVSINTIITAYGYNSRAFRMYMKQFALPSVKEIKEIPYILKYRCLLKRKYDLKRIDILGILMNKENFNVFTYPKVMHPDGRTIGSGNYYIGSSALLREENSNFDNVELNEIYKDNNRHKGENTDVYDESENIKIIYVSLGTVFNDSIQFYRRIFKAFGDTGYKLIISCGSQYDRLSRMNKPSNIELFSYVDQHEVFSKAILFITAGGMNSICEAAASGVPCLLCPQQGEQMINAERFEGLGLGRLLKDGESIYDEAEELIADFRPEERKIKAFSKVYLEELIIKIHEYVRK
ncbi:MAG: hypothetical protein IJV15_00520 [Lachnospiraceae bacterium]|nr:hypothetical protein [Lachnospiraceae bacterium]